MITEIKVTVKRLIALKKFENVTYECEAKATVAPDDNANEVYDHLLKFCKNKISYELDRIEGKPVLTALEEDYIATPGFQIHKEKE